MKRSYILLGVFFILLIGLIKCGGVDNPAPQTILSPEQAKNESTPEKNVKVQSNFSRRVEVQTDSRIALKNFLKDPDSAEIRNHNGNCGEVNSKNSFGGYTGFRRFIASSAMVAVEGENMDASEFQEAWNHLCN